ncbi:tRNA 2-thiocytidine(32) synthetase TtcA, partial [Neisseria meningitidis]
YWDKRFPGRIESMCSALQNVVPSPLADTEPFGFVGWERGQSLNHGGDLAFDSEKMPERFSDGREEDEWKIKTEPQKADRKVIN